MALFPASPSNGATANVNGYQFTFDSGTNIWTRTQSFTGSLAVTTISASGNANVGNLGTVGLITATGNITGNYILGNGALLTGVITSVANINNGTSNVTVVSSGGNVTVGVGGTSNVAVFATTGEYITGLLSVTGNISGGNIAATTAITRNSRNVPTYVAQSSAPSSPLIGDQWYDIDTGLLYQYQNDGTSSYWQDMSTNVGTLANLSVTGNIVGGNLIGVFANGNSNISIPAANGNVNISAVGNANIVVVTGTGANITGTLNISGVTTFSGVGQRILGDFSNGTTNSRTSFQDKTANTLTAVAAIPNGTATQAEFDAWNASDTSNASLISMVISSTTATIYSSKQGTGSYLPMTFVTGGSEAARFDTSRNLMIGTTTTSGRLTVAVAGVANTATVFSNGNLNATPSTTANMWRQAAFVANGSFGGGIAMIDPGVIPANSGFLMYLTSNQYVIQYAQTGGNTGSAGVSLTSTGTSWSAFSDERLKTDLQPITDAIQKSASLRTVTGRYKTDPEGTVRSFLIAQDVLPVVPSAVSTDADGMMRLSRDELIPLLFATVNELSAQLAELKTEVNNLKKPLN